MVRVHTSLYVYYGQWEVAKATKLPGVSKCHHYPTEVLLEMAEYPPHLQSFVCLVILIEHLWKLDP